MKRLIDNIQHTVRLAVFAGVLLLIAGVTYLVYKLTQDKMTLDVEQKIDITPEQITAMEQIGEWEFLSIADEELIDTVRKGLFSNDELVRIYYGTLRLGINMHKTQPHWITPRNDSVLVMLPPVELLDNDFIDEARTRSFFESGKWTEKDLQALYDRAYRQMRKRCLTKENIQSAEDNATAQFYKLMKSMGYENVIIRFNSAQTN